MDFSPDLSLLLSLEPHVSSGMSEFQMDHFVIKDSITPYRQLRQIIVETRARLENITSIGFDIEELKIKKEKAEWKISDLSKQICSHEEIEYEIRLMKVQMDRCDFELNRKQSILNQQNAEVMFFNNQLIDLVNKVFGGPAKVLEDFKNSAFHNDNEKHFWTHKLARGAQSDLVNYGTISKGTLEAIMNLKQDQQKEIMNIAAGLAESTQRMLSDSRDTCLVSMDT